MSSRDEAVAKVRALIERAVHPSTPEEEARTSALIAAKLIKSSGLEVTTPKGSGPSASTKPPQTDEDDRWEAIRRQSHRRRRQREVTWVLLVSAYRGRCKSCRLHYEAGDEICWRRGSGATHFDCRSYWDDVTVDDDTDVDG